MNDPLSPLVAPPPRYLLESDSSDEEGQGEYPHPDHQHQHQQQGSSRNRPKPKLRIKRDIALDVADAAVDEDGQVFIGMSQAGRYLKKITGTGTSSNSGSANQVQGEIKVDDVVIGSIWAIGKAVRVVSLDESDLSGEEVWEIVRLLKEKIKAKKWTVLTSYVPSMYIPSSTESVDHIRHEPPIRVFSSSHDSSRDDTSSNAKITYTFDAPNYLTGVAAGLVSLAAHPTSSFPQPNIFILPLPLSSLSIPALTQSISSITGSSTLVDIIKEAAGIPTGRSRRSSSRWTEDDDEPFSAFGMGKVKGSKRGVGEAASMYM
ncbi:hypothetical protein IAT40_007857 [Kwoniella sp. CBS 6097]